MVGTMSQQHPWQIFTPRKRKAWESPSPSPSPSLLMPSPSPPPEPKLKRSASASPAPPKPTTYIASNRLLAGYMAHEFLTKGTLLGQHFDPPSQPPKNNNSLSGECKRVNSETHHSYGEVASILMTDETQIPGIVNPTQLARWMQT